MQPRKPPQRLQYLSAQLQHALLAVHVGHQHEVFIEDAGHALGLVATWDDGVRWMGRRAAEPTSSEHNSSPCRRGTQVLQPNPHGQRHRN